MLLVRFQPTTNFRVDPVTGEATWVPTLEEIDQLYETLGMTNYYNLQAEDSAIKRAMCKRAIGKHTENWNLKPIYVTMKF